MSRMLESIRDGWEDVVETTSAALKATEGTVLTSQTLEFMMWWGGFSHRYRWDSPPDAVGGREFFDRVAMFLGLSEPVQTPRPSAIAAPGPVQNAATEPLLKDANFEMRDRGDEDDIEMIEQAANEQVGEGAANAPLRRSDVSKIHVNI